MYLSARLSVVNQCQALHHAPPAELCNLLVKTVEQVRRERLAILVKEAGSLVAVGKQLGLSARDSTLSQIKNQSKSSHTEDQTKVKVMGSPLARRLEAAFGKPEGWMDTDPDLEWPFMTISPQVYRALDERLKGIVEASARSALQDLMRGEALTGPPRSDAPSDAVDKPAFSRAAHPSRKRRAA